MLPMEAKRRSARFRLTRGLGALADRGLGRGSLAAAAAAFFLAARSPGAALVFVLLPAYITLSRGDFSAPGDMKTAELAGPDGPGVSPGEIPVRLAAAALAALAAVAALTVASVVAQRFRTQVFALPWGLAAACVSSSLLLAAVHLPILAAGGRRAGRTAAGAVFAAAGVAAALSTFPVGSMYAAFLWLLYSGSAGSLYLPLLAGSSALACLSAAASWALARERPARR